MPNNRAYYIGQMLQSIRQRRKELSEANDPSKAAADSLAVSTERIAQGTASPVDSTRALMAGKIKAPVEDKPTDYGQALARIRGGRGDAADSIHVGLKQRAQAPPTPSYSIREGVDPNTGQPVFLRSNSRTGGLEPVKTGYKPSVGKKDDDPEKEYVESLHRSNELQGEIARIDNVLNDPKMKDGAETEDEFGTKKFVDRAALSSQREGLVKEQRIHLSKTAKAELNSTLPPSKHAGKTVTDKATGARYRSDGKQWDLITE